MDWGQRVFKGIYKATSLLVGVAAHKAVGVPGLLSLLLSKTAANALPTTAGIMTGAGSASLALNFHSAHALVLFTAIRADKKYGEQREHLAAISKAMETFEKSIKRAISSSRPVPKTLPSLQIDLKNMPTSHQGAAYAKLVKDAIAHTQAFVAAQDIILRDIHRCIEEANRFLKKQKQFLTKDKPGNIFEQLGHGRLRQQRQFLQFDSMTSFSRAVNSLINHRNKWARLLDLQAHASLPRLQFG